MQCNHFKNWFFSVIKLGWVEKNLRLPRGITKKYFYKIKKLSKKNPWTILKHTSMHEQLKFYQSKLRCSEISLEKLNYLQIWCVCTYFVFPIFKHLWPKSLRVVMMVPTFIWWIEKYISDGFRKILNSILYCTLHLPHTIHTHTHTHPRLCDAHEDSVHWLCIFWNIQNLWHKRTTSSALWYS